MLIEVMEAMQSLSQSLSLSVSEFLFGRQYLLFGDLGDLTPVRRTYRPPLKLSYEARKDRLLRLQRAINLQRKINFEAKPRRRKAKMLSHWIWECPADLVDIICPEIGEPLIAELYERAAKVREKMKKVRLKKANCYPVAPIVLERLNPREMGIDLYVKERFE